MKKGKGKATHHTSGSASAGHTPTAASGPIFCECHTGTIFQCARCKKKDSKPLEPRLNTFEPDFLHSILSGQIPVEISIHEVRGYNPTCRYHPVRYELLFSTAAALRLESTRSLREQNQIKIISISSATPKVSYCYCLTAPLLFLYLTRSP